MGTAAEEEALAHFWVREPHLEAVVLTYKHMVNRCTLFHCTESNTGQDTTSSQNVRTTYSLTTSQNDFTDIISFQLQYRLPNQMLLLA